MKTIHIITKHDPRECAGGCGRTLTARTACCCDITSEGVYENGFCKKCCPSRKGRRK